MSGLTPPELLRLVGAGLRSRIGLEWRATGLYAASLERPQAHGFANHPRDFRPTDAARGAATLAGRFHLAGADFDVGPGQDPWDRPSPSRRFAVDLHRFAWLPDLLAEGDAGAREALRLWLGWRALFGRRPADFAWSGEVVERRLYNLLCGARRLVAVASDAETRTLSQALAVQARHGLRLDAAQGRRVQRLTVAALAGAALAGPAGRSLAQTALTRLPAALVDTVLPDGGLATRAPEEAVELLFDLTTLDDALMQAGRVAPAELSRAIDRLTGATRVFALGDGRLGAFNGGGAGQPQRIAAALAYDEGRERAFDHAPHSGYHRLSGRRLQALVDAGAPPPGDWSVGACAQPLALEVTCDGDRLIANAGWTPDAAAPAGLRLTAAGSTLEVEGASAGAPYVGTFARALGPRLHGGAKAVEAARHERDGGVWLEMAHDGWRERFGLVHLRRLHLDPIADALRGEDRLAPATASPRGGRRTSFAIRFHLPPGITARVARDRRSVLLRGASDRGWWLRNDAVEAALEPSLHVDDGCARRASQIVLRGSTDPLGAACIRWKLAPVDEVKTPVVKA